MSAALYPFGRLQGKNHFLVFSFWRLPEFLDSWLYLASSKLPMQRSAISLFDSDPPSSFFRRVMWLHLPTWEIPDNLPISRSLTSSHLKGPLAIEGNLFKGAGDKVVDIFGTTLGLPHPAFLTCLIWYLFDLWHDDSSLNQSLLNARWPSVTPATSSFSATLSSNNPAGEHLL